MQRQNDLAINLLNLYNPNSYVEFGEGYFVNQPKMTGYYYIFKNISNPKMCLILNTSDINYASNQVKIKDYVFIVFNIDSLDSFIKNLSTKYMVTLLGIVDQNIEKKITRNLPYGYYYDPEGDLKIDIKKANEVKRIYNMYIDTGSVREITKSLRTNFSHIQDILHDNEEYINMKEKIVPITMLKQVNEILAQNVKGRFKKLTVVDRIKQIQKKIKK